jgi:hypothetical protein
MTEDIVDGIAQVIHEETIDMLTESARHIMAKHSAHTAKKAVLIATSNTFASVVKGAQEDKELRLLLIKEITGEIIKMWESEE